MNNLSRCLPCDGVKAVTPLPIFNRPGLPALNYRIGSHSTFFQSLLARISTFSAEELADLSRTLNEQNHRRTTRQNTRASQVEHPLRDWLTTRDKTDPSIALLDAWAVLADVLTFYQERIANEGYLRTAVERRSIEQLARLTGYCLRPGVSSTVYLAFEVEDALQPNFGNDPPSSQPTAPVVIPKGTAAKSTPVPGSNEEPQTFETAKELSARKEWNQLRPRLTRPQSIVAATVSGLNQLYLSETGLQLKPNNVVAILFGDSLNTTFFRIQEVEEFADSKTTVARFIDNPLRIERLVRNIRQLAAQLFDALRARLTEEKRHYLTKELGKFVEDQLKAASAASLVNADERLTSELVCKILLDLDSVQPTLSFVLEVKRLFTIATTATTHVVAPLYAATIAFRSTLISIYSEHLSRLECLGHLHASLSPLLPNPIGPFSTPNAAKADAALKRALGSIAVGPVPSGPAHEDALTVIGAAGSMKTTDKIPLPVWVESVGTENRFTAYITIAAKTAGADITVNTKELTDVTLTELNSQLAAVEINTNNALAADIRVDVANSFTGNVLDVVSLRVVRGAQPVSDVSLGRSPLKFTGSSLPVADDIQIETLNFDAKWACRLSCRLPLQSGGLKIDGAPKSEVAIQGMATADEFKDAVKRVQFEFDLQTKAAFQVVLFEFFPEGFTDAMGNKLDPVVATTRHIAIHSAPESATYRETTEKIMGSIGVIAIDPLAAATAANVAAWLPNIDGTTTPRQVLKDSIDRFPNENNSKIIAETTKANSASIRATTSGLPAILQQPLEACAKDCEKAVDGFPAAAANAVGAALLRAENLAAAAEPEISRFLRGDEITGRLNVLKVALEGTVGETIRKCGVFDAGVPDLRLAPKRHYLADIRQFAVQVHKELLAVRFEFIRQLEEILKSFRQSAQGNVEQIGLFLDELKSIRKEFQDDVNAVAANNHSPCDASKRKTLDDAVCFTGAKVVSSGCRHDLDTKPSPFDADKDGELFRTVHSLISHVSTSPSTSSDKPPDSDELEFAFQRFRSLLSLGGAIGVTAVHELGVLLAAHSDLISQLVGKLSDGERDVLTKVLRSYVQREPAVEAHVCVMSTEAHVFGWNAPEFISPKENEPPYKPLDTASGDESADRLYLDAKCEGIRPGDLIAVQYPEGAVLRSFFVERAAVRPRTAYGLSSDCTELTLRGAWWNPADNAERIKFTRNARVYCDAQPLKLAEEPAEKSNLLKEGLTEIELDDVQIGLQTERPLIVEGVPEFVKFPETKPGESQQPGFIQHFANLVSVRHFVNKELYGDRFRTRITISNKLPYRFYLNSLRIYANVVEATHGETQRETLGGGNSAVEFQKFALKRPDVSQLIAPTPSGVKNALAVRVNNVEWSEQPSLKDTPSVAKQFATKTDDAQRTTVHFGDGVNGARVPTGGENVRAEYRTGLGRKGNVGPGQINQLMGAPLGVKKVNNPLAAKGGADPEPRDDARSHAPLAVTAMDRLVSLQDFEDFARTYAGIGKASASLLQGAVQVTIAGFDPDPLGRDNPLFQNLQQAMSLFGDPAQRFELHDREAALLILKAKIKIAPHTQWDIVQVKIRRALLQRFHYDWSELGQDILLSDAIAAVQDIPEVVYVDIDNFDAVRQDEVGNLPARFKDGSLQRRARIYVDSERLSSDRVELAHLPPHVADAIIKERIEASTGASYDPDAPRLRPAQLCYLTPDIPDTLILELIP